MIRTSSRAHVRAGLTSRALVLKLGIAGVFALVAACSASHPVDSSADDTPSGPAVDTSEAIVHGAVDKGHHPAVVALVLDGGDHTGLCSGSLIAPDVVLTARHCVEELKSEMIDCPAKGPQFGKKRAASSISVIVDANAGAAKSAAAVGAEIITPPGSTLCNADIALIRLDRKIEGIEPLTLSVDDAGNDLAGLRVVTVGYGLTGNGTKGKAGERRFRSHVAIESSTVTEFTVGESTCQGDSGGPAIDETDGTILGVVSRGGGDCAGSKAHNIYTRVDAFKGFIEKVIGALDPGTGDDTGADAGHRKKKPKTPPKTDVGEPCTSGTTCSAGVCVEPAGYCSKPCGKGHGRCGHGYKCSHTKKGDLGVCTKK